MQYPIISEQVPVAATSYSGKLSGTIFDKLLFTFRADDNSNGLIASEADDCEIIVNHKRQDGDKIIVQSNLLDIAKYTNGLGGIGYIMGSNSLTRLFALLDVGTVDTRNGQDIHAAIKMGACGTLTNATIMLYGIRTHNKALPQKCYESIASAGDYTFKDAIEVYLASAAAGVTASVNDGINSISVYDYVAHALSMALGQYESSEDFSCLYVDPTGSGRDVNVKVASGKLLFAVRYVR